jgi:hypothetical protein
VLHSHCRELPRTMKQAFAGSYSPEYWRKWLGVRRNASAASVGDHAFEDLTVKVCWALGDLPPGDPTVGGNRQMVHRNACSCMDRAHRHRRPARMPLKMLHDSFEEVVSIAGSSLQTAPHRPTDQIRTFTHEHSIRTRAIDYSSAVCSSLPPPFLSRFSLRLFPLPYS